MLTLSVRVPTNAQAFTLRVNLLTAEYAEWVCSVYDDTFVSLLTSGYDDDPQNPGDQNIATFVSPDDDVYPLSPALAFDDTGLFRQCVNGPTGCVSGASPSTMSTCTGTAELQGTGFEVADPGTCDATALIGGGTGWLRIAGNVVPGEVIQLRIGMWDTGDATGDSHVLVDAFTWLPDSVMPGMTVAN
jgi:hypothetical protein